MTYRLGYLGVPQLVEGDIEDLRANQLHVISTFRLGTHHAKLKAASQEPNGRFVYSDHLLRISTVGCEEVFSWEGKLCVITLDTMHCTIKIIFVMWTVFSFHKVVQCSRGGNEET